MHVKNDYYLFIEVLYPQPRPSTASKKNPRMSKMMIYLFIEGIYIAPSTASKMIISYLLKAYSPVNLVKIESAHVKNDYY